jgi:hypothetical protein
MDRRQPWIGFGLAAALIAAAAPVVAHAAPGRTAGSCSEAVVVERHYGQPHASASGRGVDEVYLSLSNGQHLDGPADLGTTGFFWDYTPGHKVGICVEALHPSRLRVEDRMTGSSFLAHPSAATPSGS